MCLHSGGGEERRRRHWSHFSIRATVLSRKKDNFIAVCPSPPLTFLWEIRGVLRFENFIQKKIFFTGKTTHLVIAGIFLSIFLFSRPGAWMYLKKFFAITFLGVRKLNICDFASYLRLDSFWIFFLREINIFNFFSLRLPTVWSFPPLHILNIDKGGGGRGGKDHTVGRRKEKSWSCWFHAQKLSSRK